jgi:hypothetical protein
MSTFFSLKRKTQRVVLGKGKPKRTDTCQTTNYLKIQNNFMYVPPISDYKALIFTEAIAGIATWE